MLDVLATIFFAAYMGGILVVLIGAAPTPRSRAIVAAAAGAWLAPVLAAVATGVFGPGSLGRWPSGLVLSSVLLGALIIVWTLSSRVRAALAAVEHWRIIALHVFRLGGLFFVALALDGRLGPVFAWVAGIGDVFVGGFALVLVIRLRRGRRVSDRVVQAWNSCGLIDLMVALGAAGLSSPALGLIAEEPGMRAMGTLPWALVPAVVVPALALTHLVLSRTDPSSAVRAARFVTGRTA